MIHSGGKETMTLFLYQNLLQAYQKGISREKYKNQSCHLVLSALSSYNVCKLCRIVCKVFILIFRFPYTKRHDLYREIYLFLHLYKAPAMRRTNLFREQTHFYIEMHFAPQNHLEMISVVSYRKAETFKTNLNAELCCTTVLTIHFSCIALYLQSYKLQQEESLLVA